MSVDYNVLEKFLDIDELELAAELNATSELEDLIEEAEEEDGALFDFLKANIEGFDELVDVDFDEDDVEVTILELGLEDDEDKVVSVVFELKVKYEPEESTDTFKKKVTATANVVFEEGDFTDEEVKLVFTLI